MEKGAKKSKKIKLAKPKGGKKIKVAKASKVKAKDVKVKVKAKDVKVKKAKVKKAKTPRQEPTSGQMGPKINILVPSAKERKVAEFLVKAKKATLEAIGDACFKGVGKDKGNSWARNSLRRLVRAGWVKKVGRGTYETTPRAAPGLKTKPEAVAKAIQRPAKKVKVTKKTEAAKAVETAVATASVAS